MQNNNIFYLQKITLKPDLKDDEFKSQLYLSCPGNTPSLIKLNNENLKGWVEQGENMCIIS